MILFALILNVAAFLALAMAGERSYGALLGRDRRLRRPIHAKAAGALLIAASWLALWSRIGFASAIVMSAGLSTVGAAIAVLCVTMGRRLRRH